MIGRFTKLLLPQFLAFGTVLVYYTRPGVAQGNDPKTPHYCGGKMYARDPNCSLRCCGDQRYDIDNQLCCYGPGGPMVKDQTYGWRSSCCGIQVYNRDTHTCCRGSIVQRPAFAIGRVICCGDVAIDSWSHKCCYFLDRAIAMENSDSTACCYDYHSGNITVYNRNKEICCSGKVVIKATSGDIMKNKNICCGTSAYNVYTQACCEDRVVTANFSRGDRGQILCCGAAAYNPEIHLCCDGNVRERKTVLSRCCGNQVYQIGLQICCKGFLKTIEKGEEAACCGPEAYNRRTHICCSPRGELRGRIEIVRKKKGAVTNCCWAPTGQAASYNADTQVCCQGVVAEGQGLLTRCCGNKTYDSTTKACCQNQVVEANFPRVYVASCCGATAYSQETHVCCSGKVSRKESVGYGACCGEEAFDPATHFCCNGVVVEKANNSLRCCEKQVYDTRTHLCCSGGPVLKQPADIGYMSCCGKEIINLETHMCCRSGREAIILPKPRDEKGRTNHRLRCCYNTTYDPKVFKCCASGQVKKTCPAREYTRSCVQYVRGYIRNTGGTGLPPGFTGCPWGSSRYVYGPLGGTGYARGSSGYVQRSTGYGRGSSGYIHGPHGPSGYARRRTENNRGSTGNERGNTGGGTGYIQGASGNAERSTGYIEGSTGYARGATGRSTGFT